VPGTRSPAPSKRGFTDRIACAWRAGLGGGLKLSRPGLEGHHGPLAATPFWRNDILPEVRDLDLIPRAPKSAPFGRAGGVSPVIRIADLAMIDRGLDLVEIYFFQQLAAPSSSKEGEQWRGCTFFPLTQRFVEETTA